MKVRQVSEEQLARYNEMLISQEVNRAERRGIAKGFRFSTIPTLALAGFIPEYQLWVVGIAGGILLFSQIAITANSREIESEI